jgi:phage shock protein A
LQHSAAEGEAALAEMKRRLEQTEQEVAELRSRREQAEVESQTLDLVSSATANRETAATSLNRAVGRLQDNVEQLQARNEARHGIMSIANILKLSGSIRLDTAGE